MAIDTRNQAYALGAARDLEPPAKLWPGYSEDDFAAVVNRCYRQVFGNIGLMESERCSSAESRLRNGELTVRGFIQELGQSDTYRRLFFERTTPHRFVELNFKHFLGRPPAVESEITEHVLQLMQGGFEAEIESYIASDEYTEAFGDDTVPYLRSITSLTGFSQDTFNKTYRLKSGASGSDSTLGRGSRTIGNLMGYAFNQIPLPSGGRAVTSPSSFGRSTSGLDSAPLSASPYGSFGVGEQQQLRWEKLDTTTPQESQELLRVIYRQVMGNPHIMESERPVAIESRFINGELSVRAFIRELCNTDLYRNRFFSGSAPYRFVELCFKNLLGRAPESQAELRGPLDKVVRDGYSACIDHFLDSEEYSQNFGEDVVPYLRGVISETGRQQSTFNRTIALVPGYSGSDTVGKDSRLINQVTGPANQIIPVRSTAASGAYDATGKRFRILVTSQTFGSRRRRSTTAYEVAGDRMTSQLAFIHKSSGRIVSITEIK